MTNNFKTLEKFIEEKIDSGLKKQKLEEKYNTLLLNIENNSPEKNEPLLSEKSKLWSFKVAKDFNDLMVGQKGRDTRMDANAALNFASQLEAMQTKLYMEPTEPLTLGSLISTLKVDDGADSTAYEERSRVGQAGLISNWADDLPNVGESGAKVSRDIKYFGDSVDWSVKDIQAAAFAGKQLDSRLLVRAEKAFLEKMENVLAVGESGTTISDGLLNNANIPTNTATVGVWGSTPSGSIGTAMLTDISQLIGDTRKAAAGSYPVNNVVMTIGHYERCASTPVDSTSGNTDQRTVLEALRSRFPDIKFSSSAKCNGVSSGATGSVAVCFSDDPDVVQKVISTPFQMMPPQLKNLVWRVSAWGGTGGTIVRYANACRLLTGMPISTS